MNVQKAISPVSEHPSLPQQDEQKQMIRFSGKYYVAVGRRKTSSAQVRLFHVSDEKEKGLIFINNSDYRHYFPTSQMQKVVESPLQITGLFSDFCLKIAVRGGGVQGQAGAAQLAIARALLKWNPDLKAVLRTNGLLTRDSRMKERKKPGLKRARRAPQWQKR